MRGLKEYLPEPSAIPVEVVLSDGQLLRGTLLVPVGKSIVEHLNSTAPFVDFADYANARRYLAKAHIVSFQIDALLANQPSLPRHSHSNPYEILGLDPSAAPGIARQYYLTLIKRYHPDRFNGMELPNEVTEYLAAMARRINAAYAALEGNGHVPLTSSG